jgi:hypothetical protein
MTDEDERALAQLEQVFGDKVGRGNTDVAPTDDVGVDDQGDDDVDQRFAEALMQPGIRKWRERQERRDKDDRRQEGQDRWRDDR